MQKILGFLLMLVIFFSSCTTIRSTMYPMPLGYYIEVKHVSDVNWSCTIPEDISSKKNTSLVYDYAQSKMFENFGGSKFIGERKAIWSGGEIIKIEYEGYTIDYIR